MKIPFELILPLVTKGVEVYLDMIRIKMEAEGRTEVTVQDLEDLKLVDPEEVIKRYRKSQGL